MKTYRVTVNGTAYDVAVEETSGAGQPVNSAPVSDHSPAAAVKPAAAAPAPKPEAAPAAKPQGTGNIKIDSPLPGNMFKVLVKPGDTITKGQVVFVIEAMKMENEIVSPYAGTVVSVLTKEGTTVNPGDVILTMNE